MGRKRERNPIRAVMGANIRALRDSQGLSQELFADMIGICRTTMIHIESGVANATIDQYIKIADGLDVPLPALLKGLEDSAPHRLPADTLYAIIGIPKEKPKGQG